MAKKGINIYRRKDGRWEARFYIKGSRKYKSVYARSYTEAKDKLALIQDEVYVPSNPCKLRFSDVLDLWLTARRDTIKTTSFLSYKTKIDKHILPWFGRKKYCSLSSDDLDKFKSEKLLEGLSEKYVADMVVLIKSITRYAILVHNYADPFQRVKPPKTTRTEPKLLTADEQKRFIHKCMFGGLAGLGCFLAMFAGLRIGEVCGLRWENIDLTAGVLSVRNSVARVGIGEKSKSTVMLLPPKSETSARDIPLPKFLINLLKTFRSSPDHFILSDTVKPIEPRTMTNRFKSLLKKAEVPSVKFHSLRHSFATNFLRKTGDIKSLSEILGHSSVNITLRVYIHSSMEQKLKCMEQMAAFL